jgi:signal-transduction protein with cAMP-binding, CBS, and nucleotidyltransferase domain
MKVSDILEEKGPEVKSVFDTDSVQTLAERLTVEKIGAMVVLTREGALAGIVSERDLTHGVSTYGSAVLQMPVSTIMTRSVITCSPADSLFGVAKVMDTRRIRHVPVLQNGSLKGLISIGDVLTRRLEELRDEASALRQDTGPLR